MNKPHNCTLKIFLKNKLKSLQTTSMTLNMDMDSQRLTMIFSKSTHFGRHL